MQAVTAVLLTVTGLALVLVAVRRTRTDSDDRALSERLRREAQYDRRGWEGPTFHGKFWQ